MLNTTTSSCIPDLDVTTSKPAFSNLSFCPARIFQSPRVILTIKSSRSSKDVGTQYLLESNGMFGSPRVFNSKDITIGRQQITESGERPNDIMLDPCDSFISRTHCKLRYNEGMHSHHQLSDSIWAFFMGTHFRLGNKSYISSISRDLISEIISYLKPTRRFFISDMRSVTGTYIKLQKRVKLEPNSLFLINHRLAFTIVLLSSPDNLSFSQNSCSMIVPKCTYSPYKYNTLISILMLHGCPSISMLPSQSYWFVAANSPNLFIGPDCDIPADIKGRIKISYETGWWAEDLGTEFGVWLSTSGLRGSENRFDEREVEISKGEYIKISETVIKVEW